MRITGLMSNDKPGGYGAGTVANSVIDMAVWDAVATVEVRPLYQLYI